MEHSTQKAAHVLDHHGTRLGLGDDVDGVVEKVPLVLLAQLFAGHGKGWAGQAACEQIDAFEIRAAFLEHAHVLFQNIPRGAVVAQGGAAVFVDLDQCCMGKARFLQPECLTARARTYLD